ncbi:MarR family winged helix-turn-helix transcriptional regulator [Candidatus Nitrosotalea bavarica]|uniref:MarR family winged helix-turn-helix transcriptional regulator n=1 Tax=Candidatus Nitrosotalea bavarica TaxID=1903277 RepID=UPI000C703B0F|nr:MarR family transcriptional regulator [Candidatus Nitrosotalea bavarica]
MRKLDLNDSIGMLIALASKSQERLADLEMRKQLGLTPAHWRVILALNISDGLTQKELADKIYVDGSTLVPVIDKMEQNGLVERRADPNDRRMNRIFLTKKSESTVDSITLIVLQLRKMIYRGISGDEINSTRKILATMIKNSDTIINELKSSEQSAT